MERQRFLGNKMVTNVVVMDTKTPKGADILEITFDTGIKIMMPKLTFDELVTYEPISLSDLQTKKMEVVVTALVETSLEYDIHSSEFSKVTKLLEMSYMNNLNQTSHLLWGGTEDMFTPGADVEAEPLIGPMTLLKSVIIRQENAKESKKGDE